MLNLLDGWFKINLGDAAFYALLGFLFVFIGITLLILIFTLLGYIMKKVSVSKDNKNRQQSKKQNDVSDSEPALELSNDEVTPELVAVLTAAVAACLQEENSKCEFVVRRIKKL